MRRSPTGEINPKPLNLGCRAESVPIVCMTRSVSFDHCLIYFWGFQAGLGSQGGPN